jgi:hypothetical protein
LSFSPLDLGDFSFTYGTTKEKKELFIKRFESLTTDSSLLFLPQKSAKDSSHHYLSVSASQGRQAAYLRAIFADFGLMEELLAE